MATLVHFRKISSLNRCATKNLPKITSELNGHTNGGTTTATTYRWYTKTVQRPWRTKVLFATSLIEQADNRFIYQHSNSILCSQRFYANNSDTNDSNTNDNESDQTPKRKEPRLPELMDSPFLVWPSIVHTIKNWIFVTLIIKPYFDNEFCIKEFARGSKQALEVVSNRLAAGDFKSLNGLVDDETLGIVRKRIERMSLAQRSAIAVNCEDVYFSFPYQVGIIFDDEEEENENEVQKRFVEITMVFHTMKDRALVHEHRHELPWNIG